MKQRPWIPVAAVLVLLLAGTVASGFWLRDRLDAAAAVLDPLVEPDLAEIVVADDDLGVPLCADTDVIGELRAFHEEVATSRAEAEADGDVVPELTSTRTSFDSFLLESATARIAAGKNSLVVWARPANGAWCVDDAEFSTEE